MAFERIENLGPAKVGKGAVPHDGIRWAVQSLKRRDDR